MLRDPECLFLSNGLSYDQVAEEMQAAGEDRGRAEREHGTADSESGGAEGEYRTAEREHTKEAKRSLTIRKSF